MPTRRAVGASGNGREKDGTMPTMSDAKGRSPRTSGKRGRYKIPTRSICELLAIGHGPHEVASILGCHYDTVWRRRYSDPENFERELQNAIESNASPIRGKVAHAATVALDVLLNDLVHGEWQARHSAARTLLEVAGFRRDGLTIFNQLGIAVSGSGGAVGESAADAIELTDGDSAFLALVEDVREDSRRVGERSAVLPEASAVATSGSNGPLPGNGNGDGRDTEE